MTGTSEPAGADQPAGAEPRAWKRGHPHAMATRAPSGGDRREIEDWLVRRVADRLGVPVDDVDPHRALADYGFSSADAVAFTGDVERRYAIRVSPTLFWEHPTVRAVSEHLAAPATRGDEVRAARFSDDRAMSAQAAASEPVAVIGAGCRLPGGADSPDALWRLLVEGRDAVREGPWGRWDLGAFYDDQPATPGRTVSRWAGYLDDISGFDAAFFGISPREAAAMDPQHRLLLEVAWEALEHAGIPPRGLVGSRAGVFAGLSYTDYAQRMVGRYPQLDAYVGTGNAHSVAAGRVSYLLGLNGPSLAIDTACSSSLVAIHLACQSLRMRECDLALAGGGSLLIRPEQMIIGSQWGMFSPTGRCRPFDAGADGFVRGEGAAVVALKRLADAVRDGDRILAVVRGSAVNSDGRSQGLTAPSVAAQRAVLRAAVEQAGVDPAAVGLVETHGTGTPLGDPIEFRALASVYGDGGHRRALGAVKSNIGHTEAAAGAAGFIKAVLCLRHGVIPPNLHFARWNPEIAAEDGRLFVPTKVTPWPVPADPRLAAVSSFGMSGTNAHVVLEQAPTSAAVPTRHRRAADPGHERSRARVFVLSAASESGLLLAARRLVAWLRSAEDPALDDVAATLAMHRSHHRVRLAIVASGRDDLVARLTAFTDGDHDGLTRSGSVRAGSSHGPVWIFPGQGSQWPGMCGRLLRAEPAFAAAIAEVEPLIAGEAGFSVRALLDAASLPSAVDRIQPALFAVQIALAAAWRARGVEPAAVIGHSMGEAAAAVVSGALSVADGVRVICRRSRSLARVAGTGAMASVDMSRAQVEADLADAGAAEVTVAVEASPRSTVVTGTAAQVDRLLARWDRRGVWARRVAADVAAHSPQVDPVLDELEKSLADLSPATPTVPCYSTVTVDPRTPVHADARYWRSNVREPVRFAAAVAAAAADGYTAFVEISPHPLLVPAVTETCAERDRACLALATVSRDQDEPERIDAGLAALYCAGVPVSWERQLDRRALVDLPTIAWDRKRHWQDLPLPHPDDAMPGSGTHPLLGAHVRVPGGDGRHVWEGDIGTDVLPWLADHRVDGTPVLPGAAVCEMVLAAGAAVLGVQDVAVVDLRLERALPLDPHTVASTIATPRGGDVVLVEIGVCGDHGAWTRHAVAEARHEPDRSAPPRVDLDETGTHHVPVDAEACYAVLRAAGYDHGPAFAGLRTLRASPDGNVVAEVRVPGVARGATGRYRLHPVLLDTCLQALAAGAQVRDRFVPAGIGALRVFGDAARVVRCVGRLDLIDDGSATGHVSLLDADGAVIAHANDVHLTRWADPAGSQRIDPMLYEIRWEPVRSPPATTTPPAGPWLVAGSDGDMVARVRKALGSTCTALHLPPGDTVHAGDLITDALRTIRQHHHAPCRGVVLITSAGPDAAPDVPRRARDEIMRLATIVRTLSLGSDQPPRLWVVTHGAQQVRPSDAIDLDTPALRGLGRVAMHEHAELRPALVDLDPDVSDADALADRLVSEVLADRTEDEVAWRGDERLVARIVGAPLHDGSRQWRRLRLRCGPDGFGLAVTRPGDLGTLDLASRPRRDPGPGEVEIQVRAASLNFHDVFVALGLHPPVDGGQPALGGDCAGVVTAVGSGVEAFRVGDQVVALAPGALGSHVVTPAALVAPLPAGMDPAAGAALPVAYLTAWYALRRVARLASGERVLIHAASGGVGLAAIAIAQATGSEIFATAGKPEKRAHLTELGVAHVMDSRTPAFRDRVLAITDGDGVDAVLNSLSGDRLRAGLDVLAVGGRFVEIGKRDTYDNSTIGMLPFRRSITLSSVDLDLIARTEPERVGVMLRDVLGEIVAGRLPSLPVQARPLTDAVTAFRAMAAAEHIGKLVLTVPDSGEVDAVVPPDTGSHVHPDGGYVITGGLGGLGLEMAGWLARRGAGRIVLNGRTAPSARAEETLARLRNAGVAVEIVLGDIAEPSVAERLVTAATRSGLRLRGVIHAAGVVTGGLVANLDAETLDRVWRPKVAGAWRLHEATAGHELDWFVLFSSVAAMIGVDGGYAAANAWLDGFASWRRARGLPATSINWGGWDAPGMASGFGWHGYRPISVADGIAALEVLLRHDRVRTGVFHFSADHMLRVLPWAASSSLFAALPLPRTHGGTNGTLAARLTALDPDRRLTALIDHLRAHVRAILDVADIDAQTPLADLGFDSLTTLQLRTRVEADLALRIPATAVWSHPTLHALATYLLGRVELDVGGDTTGPPRREQPTETWFVPFDPRPDADVRLFCFPHLGGAASTFRAWAHGAAADIEICAVQLPGREHRRREAPATDLRELAAQLAAALAADRDARPFAFFGHSGGGLLAFETARALRRLTGRTPVLLAVSAMLPPQHPELTTRVRNLLRDRSPDHIARLLGIDELRDDAALVARLSEDVRADVTLYGRYRYRREPALDCPVAAFAGRDDPLYRPEEVDGWRAQTTAGMVLRRYTGDHGYLRARWHDVVTDLAGDVRSALASRGVPREPARPKV